MGCAHNVPNIKIYKEIPFVDAPEGVYVETVTHKEGLVPAEEWRKKRVFMLMIEPEGWKVIKDQWYKECRKAGPNCNVMVDSIDGLVRKLDKISEGIFGGHP